MSLEIELIELSEPSFTLNYRPFFKHYILETVVIILFLFINVWNKICFKTELYFTLFALGWHLVLQYYRFSVLVLFL